jgi:hypothetical protein
MLTSSQLAALSDFLVASRVNHDHHWDKAGTVAALREVDESIPWQRVAWAAIKACADPRNETPAVINLDGRHWDHDQTPCRTHPHAGVRDNGECGGCWVDRKQNEPLNVPAIDRVTR